MPNNNQIDFHVGQKITVRSPVTTKYIVKGRLYKATVVDVPDVAFSIKEIAITYALLNECGHLKGRSWEVVCKGHMDKQGSSDARKIVAMLAEEYRKYSRRVEVKRLAGKDTRTLEVAEGAAAKLYRQAKQLLGENK